MDTQPHRRQQAKLPAASPLRLLVSLAVGLGLALAGQTALAQSDSSSLCRFGRIFDGEKCVWPQAGVPVSCVNGWQPVAGGCQPPAPPPAGGPQPPAPSAGAPQPVGQPSAPPNGTPGTRCRVPVDCPPALTCIQGGCQAPRQRLEPAAPGGEQLDGLRFRGAIAGLGGAFFSPDADHAVAAAGIQGEFGIQFNHVFAAYFTSGLGALLDDEGGALVADLGLLVDFTVGDAFTIGAGPELGLVLPGYSYGGRLHLAVHPVCSRGEDGIRRKAFTIGADVRVKSVTIEGLFGTSKTIFAVQPTLSLGYTAF